jgi:hypothetical protein
MTFKGGDTLRDQNRDGSIVLKWIFKKEDVK